MPYSDIRTSLLATETRQTVHLPGSSGACESLIENWHWGWLAIADTRQDLLYFTPGTDALATFFRSSAKPFQALPLIETGAANQLTLEELALTCASHTASQRHVSLVRHILEKAEVPETALQCGPHAPLDKQARGEVHKAGLQPSAIHNNCSGKHAGMLLYCKQTGADASQYLNPAHPLQQAILDRLRQLSGVRDIPLAIDGCGAPVFYLPLSAMAKVYALLGTETVFNRVREAMTTYPELVGAEGRVDTVLMQVGRGSLVAKVGADGVLCVSRVGTGQGLALKMADGVNDVRDRVTVEILHQLGWLDETAWTDARLQPYRDLRRMNTQARAIGEYQIDFDPQQLQTAALSAVLGS